LLFIRPASYFMNVLKLKKTEARVVCVCDKEFIPLRCCMCDQDYKYPIWIKDVGDGKGEAGGRYIGCLVHKPDFVTGKNLCPCLGKGK
jgi:hypothetical protein